MSSSPFGRRIHVLGNSGAGKSTLARGLAEHLGVAFIDLDALYWLPGWRAPEEAEFRERLREATRGDGWVVGGSYLRHADVFWDRLETAIFLDLPVPQLLGRVLARSWRRWRSNELLWGTNRERFWPQLKIWDPESSMLGHVLRVHRERQRHFVAGMTDPRWRHVRFVRLCSQREIDQLLHALA
jgi:adenylate kinase family enzyme